MRDSDHIWYMGNNYPQSMSIHEGKKKAPAVVYNADGEPYCKPRIAMGFDLSKSK